MYVRERAAAVKAFTAGGDGCERRHSGTSSRLAAGLERVGQRNAVKATFAELRLNDGETRRFGYRVMVIVVFSLPFLRTSV
jgi:hypothetical protein